jgi:hypothetical protein
MNLLVELKRIQQQLDLIPSDNVSKQHSQALNLAKNQLMALIAKGERVEKYKHDATMAKLQGVA